MRFLRGVGLMYRYCRDGHGYPNGRVYSHARSRRMVLECPMTADELRYAEKLYQRAVARSESRRAERNRLVREALEAGWTHARIAEATGLTRSRVGQIALASR